MKLRLAVGVAAVAAIAITGAQGPSGEAAGATVARDRSVTDLPDDISGSQVHFLYVVPSDGVDGQLDTNGAFEQSIARIERWFITQAGNQGLRVDTYRGIPDITFVRLPRTDAQAAATLYGPLWIMGEDLAAAGFNDPAKVYAVLYDGTSRLSCGGAKSPALPKLGAMFVQGWPTNDPRPCRDAPGFGTGTNRPGYFEIGLLHEILHVIGFSPRCARHASADGFGDHVNDSPTDLMYGPDASSPGGWNWSNAVLDFNHDDYYRANIPGCPDLSNSPYVEALHSVSVTVNGPGGVQSSPDGIDCPGTCTGMFQRSVTLTATPYFGSTFGGWTGACSGTAECTVAGAGSATATFRVASHRRTLTLRVRAQRASGVLRVADGYEQCRVRVPVVVERRGRQGWSIVRRARTDGAGAFTVLVPRGRAAYRALAPAMTADGETCLKVVSRTAVTSA